MKNPTLIAVMICLSCVVNLAEADEYQVLMLGNSYSRGTQNRLIGFFENDPDNSLELSTRNPGGWLLVRHLNHFNENAEAREELSETDWDFVILQDQSQTPSLWFHNSRNQEEGEFWVGASGMTELIVEDTNATILYFSSWARQKDHDYLVEVFHNEPQLMAAANNGAYEFVHQHYADRSQVVYVSDAWLRSHELRPSLLLHRGDKSHGNAAGYYLAGAVFYETITGKSSVGNRYRGGIDQDTAAFLQSIATAITGAVESD